MSSKPLASPSSRKRMRSPKQTHHTEEVHEAPSRPQNSSIFSLSAPEFLHPYLSPNPKKRDGEWFFIWYTFVWVGFFAQIVIFRLWQGISDLGYNTIGLAVFIPCVVLPMIFVPTGERRIVWYRRYTFKANIWMAVFSFIGNYFWTHYFFALLGAKYTFPISTYSELNRVPFVCYLLTQAYFQTYHVVTNLLLRFVRRKFDTNQIMRTVAYAVTILAISIFWAFLETKTIESFPYYSFEDLDRMYQIGIAFYAIYFIVSFPMFIRLDEDPKDSWDWSRSLIDSLAAAMIVFTLCDFWRLIIGNIIPGKNSGTLPFL